MKVEGSCLCHSVNFSFEAKENHFGVCHCSICRQWGGGPFFAVQARGDIKLSGEENISIYPSSDWAERGFCKRCGGHLFYRLKDHRFYHFNLGAIKGHENFKLARQVYIDHKPDNYSFLNETPALTEKEVLAEFGGS